MKKQNAVEGDGSVGVVGSSGHAGDKGVPALHQVVAPKGPTRFLVRRGGSIAKNGVITKIPEGHVVRLSAYGQDGLKLMRENGIQLDPIED